MPDVRPARRAWFCLVALMALAAAGLPGFVFAAEPVVQRAPARDSFAEWKDTNPDCQTMLDTIVWKPAAFDVTWTECEGREYERLVRFPSPWESGNAVNDLVALAWYRPEEAKRDGGASKRPAVVVIHESGSAMPVGKAVAEGFRARGLNAFLIHLPRYGERREPGFRRDPAEMLKMMRQGVSDVRRAYDAVRVLPEVDPEQVSLQGTSLGGFVAATAGALDGCYRQVHITLAGGDLYSMIQNGEKDVAKVREELARGGFTGEALRDLLRHAEPLRVAHRLNPQRTWMYSARQDEVVPIANCRKLAAAIGLDKSHQAELYAGHYTGFLYLPAILDVMAERMKAPTSGSLEKP